MDRGGRDRENPQIDCLSTVMDASPEPVADDAPPDQQATDTHVAIPQYSVLTILGVWSAAAVPMAVLAWIVAPALARALSGPQPYTRALLICLTIGLIWQFALVVLLLWREQGTLRWRVVRPALWLDPPRSPTTGRVGGRLWLLVIPLIVAFGAEEMIPLPSHAASRDLGMFLESQAGITFLRGAWGWYAMILVLLIFNTILGEELLFRGFLLPRMNGAFGRGDWVANGVLFAAYHLHTPWVMPAAIFDTLILSYPSKRYRSAWFGIIVHSAQSVLIAAVVLFLVLG